MSAQRTMLSFLTGQKRFNYRVAGVAVRDGHVLVCREDDDDYVMLPGGRVEFGEMSHLALAREIEEELKHSAEVGRLLFTAENFFAREGENFHEIGLYYEMQLPESFPFILGRPCLVTEDEGHELSFDWVAAADDALGQWNLLPAWIRARLNRLPERAEHLVIDER